MCEAAARHRMMAVATMPGQFYIPAQTVHTDKNLIAYVQKHHTQETQSCLWHNSFAVDVTIVYKHKSSSVTGTYKYCCVL